ncbi:MAG: divalent-cation tolerance protein CutA [Candidatus Omnitrophota bacterium]|nr:divalent-cation tolerance protein CutA [Candidatus Omnitrophota bacterium]MDZ4242461.1 divalent-cation tolerance protein CutA [Candidatus Omnitrophota bacterium]
MKDHIVVLVTAKDAQEARKIGTALLEQKLAACVNIVPGVESLFWWQGKLDQAAEVMLVIKSRKDLFEKIVATVKALHSYEVPEVIALPVAAGHQDYLRWLDESVSPAPRG